MIKSAMVSRCKECNKSVALFESTDNKLIKTFYCRECKQVVCTVKMPEK